MHVDPDLAPEDLVAIPAEIPDALPSTRLEVRDLPRAWRRFPAPEALARIGTDWAAAGKTAALWVPSTLVPRERNVLLNPAHPDFAKIRAGTPEPFSLDPRFGRHRSRPAQ